MLQKDGKTFVCLFTCAALAAGATGCSSFRKFSIQSAVPQPPIKIDGHLGDWADRLYYVGDQLVSIGLADDGESLYVGLAVDDPEMAEGLTRAGLILWFDPQGGMKKTFGIQFPVRPESGPGGSPGGGPGARGTEDRSPMEGRRPDSGVPPEFGDSREFGFLRAGTKTAQAVLLDPKTGVEIKSGYRAGRFVYEARIPLVKAAERPWAVGVGTKRAIGLGLQTAPLSSAPGRNGPEGEPGEGPGGERMPGGGGGGMTGGGGMPGGGGGGGMPGGMGGGMPGGMGGPGRGGRSSESSQKLKLWASVTLSPGTDSAARLASVVTDNRD